ncbi:MAG: DUF99 family protein [Promethearchaeota archaeon]|nr:MAG: DUF99 family protein [Candidatus Lokiarchaeota archaeon]
MKAHPIILGIDDATFKLKSGHSYTYLIGVICQGTRMVKVQEQRIKIDGDDSTEKIIQLIKDNNENVQFVITHTITFGGFNLMNLEDVYSQTKKPIIAVTERDVDLESVKFALKKKYPQKYPKKIEYIINAGELYEMKIKTAAGYSSVYYHKKGISQNNAEELIQKSSIDSKLPEPVRMAHLIGRIFKSIA